ASAKSRQRIRQAQNQHPDALVVVFGCLPILHAGQLSIPAKNTHLIPDRNGLAATLSRLVCGPATQPEHTPASRSLRSVPNTPIKAKNGFKIKNKNKLCHNDLELSPLTSFKGQTRAFLKIQDGCDGACTYCIVPKTRPFVRSKPVEEVLLEAQALVEAGHKEIVLTGVFLGAYGQQSARRRNWPGQRNDHLADLLEKMAKFPNLSRIRLSSLEPGDVTDRLLDTLCANCNIMPHLHLSLQSGSDAILRKMCRQYGIDEFRRKIESIKSRLDRPAITTDLIVGFPGETNADFEQTVNLAREVGFAKIHVFSYSPRPGTAAARSNNKVDKKVVRERSEILREVGIELGRQFRRQFLGETAEILIEETTVRSMGVPPMSSTGVSPVKAGPSPSRAESREWPCYNALTGTLQTVSRLSSIVACGRSERYFKVYVSVARDSGLVSGRAEPAPSGVEGRNDLVRVKLSEVHENGMIGTYDL
ncbi:MAG: hypothetical protein A2Z25_05610, partial [Planctomycetes bacterium RBG_16_55_9]